MCLGAIGTQTGGSLGRPASYCGIASFKPTHGRLSMHGIVPVAFSLDVVGPMARTASNLKAMMDVMAGYDPKDPICSRTTTHPKRDGVMRPPRLGVFESFFTDEADEDMRAAMDAATERLKEAGATIATVSLPRSFGRVHEMHMRIMSAEAAMHHQETFPTRRDEYAPGLASLLEAGRAMSATEYAEARRHQLLFRREILTAFEDVDALLTPATHTAAPARLDTTGNPKFNVPWSFSGLPAATIPCAITSSGMPVALQLVGAPHTDQAVLRTAVRCERNLGFDASPGAVRSSE